MDERRKGGEAPFGLRHAQYELAEEVAAGHDFVGLGGVGEVEGLADDAAEAAVVDHVEHAAKLRRLRAPLPINVNGRPWSTERLNAIWLPAVVPVMTRRPPGLRLAQL